MKEVKMIMAEVITVGEAMVVLISNEEGELKNVQSFSKGLAGAELNVSVGLTRLGHKTKYISRLGEDPYGEYILDFIKKENIDYSSIYIDKEYLTGSYLKSKASNGDPKIFYYRKNSAASHISQKDIMNANFEGAKILHISGITAAISENCLNACYFAIKKAREYGMIVTFDPNIRKSLWKSEEMMKVTLNDIASKCDIVFPGISEGFILTGEKEPEKIADFYLNLGVKKVIVKLGAPGAYYKTYDGEENYVKGFKVESVVDTVGAGDAFASGFISGLLDKLKLAESVIRGNALGSIIVTSKTDNDILPTKEELMRYLNSN